MSDKQIVVVNPVDYRLDNDKQLFRMWASGGNCYAVTAYVWADHFEDAFEEFVEWLDDNAPGCLVDLSKEDFADAAKELGLPWPSEDTEVMEKVYEHATVDLTTIGHTSLKHGNFIASGEWGGGEADDDHEQAVKLSSSWFVVNGSRGCLPDSISEYDTREDALAGAIEMFDLTDDDAQELREHDIVLFGERSAEMGAEYVQIEISLED